MLSQKMGLSRFVKTNLFRLLIGYTNENILFSVASFTKLRYTYVTGALQSVKRKIDTSISAFLFLSREDEKTCRSL